ncbi:MAG: TraU family protein [Nitrospirae bacterium]|nr:TraU family protein [Nitrospirota bacterium]
MKIIAFIALLLTLVCAQASGAGDSLDLFDMGQILDVKQCLLAKYNCKPFACKIGKFVYGDLVCHYVPVGFVETTTGAFTSAVPFVGTALSAIASKAGQQTGGTGQKGDNHLQFFEAHVFNVPTYWLLKYQLPFLRLCSYPEGYSWSINYLSEMDAVNWRTGISDYLSMKTLIGGSVAQLTQICPVTSVSGSSDANGLNPLGDVCMGTWGVTYPRTGFSNAQSEPVASGIAAYRASRVVAKPWLRTVLTPKNFNANVSLQLGYPKWGKPRNCFERGLTPALWDNLTTKPTKGRGYIWVLWDKVCCCKTPPGCLTGG